MFNFYFQLLPENPNEKAQIVLACTKQFLVHLKDKEPANLRTVIDVLNYILTANLCGEKVCLSITLGFWLI